MILYIENNTIILKIKQNNDDHIENNTRTINRNKEHKRKAIIIGKKG